MTGLRTIRRGSSLRERVDGGGPHEAAEEGPTSAMGRRGMGLCVHGCFRPQFAPLEVLDDGAERQRRNEGQRADEQTIVPTSSPTKSGVCVGSVPALTGTPFLRASAPASASTGTITQ
jgi:hypothetical protein